MNGFLVWLPAASVGFFAADEAHIRTLLVRELTRHDFTLHSCKATT
jgi:hypothetical protein